MSPDPRAAQERRDAANRRARKNAGRRALERRLRKAGIDPHGGPTFGERLGQNLLDTARDAPRGVATFGDAFYRDAREPHDWANAARKAKREGRPPPPLFPGGPWSRTRRLLDAAKDQFVSDVRHPLRNPGNTLLSVGGLATGGALTGVRAAGVLSAASRAAKATPGRTPRVVTSKRKARKMDPGKLGVGQLVRDLEKAEKQATQGPLRAGVGAYMRRPTRPERLAGAALAANVAARRQRAARELAAQRRQAAQFRSRSQQGR